MEPSSNGPRAKKEFESKTTTVSNNGHNPFLSEPIPIDFQGTLFLKRQSLRCTLSMAQSGALPFPPRILLVIVSACFHNQALIFINQKEMK